MECQMETKMLFGEWLSHQIYMRQWDQKMLAHMSGVTAAQISRIINGTRRPGPESLMGIAAALKMPPEELYRRAGLLPPKRGVTPADLTRYDDMLSTIASLTPENQKLLFELLEKIKLSEEAARNDK